MAGIRWLVSPRIRYDPPTGLTDFDRKGRTMTRRLLLLICMAFLGTTAALGRPPTTLQPPVADSLYLQEIGHKIPTDAPVLAVAVLDGRLYAGFADGVRLLDGDRFVDCGAPAGQTRRLRVLDGAMWLITGDALHRFRDGAWHKMAGGEFRDLCLHLGQVYVAEPRRLMRVDGDGLVPVPKTDRPPGEIIGVVSYSETPYVLCPGRLALFDGDRYDRVNVLDWGKLPSSTTRAVHVQGSRLYVATDRGLGLLRGMSMTQIRGADGLCYEDVTCLADGFQNDLWIGTTQGAIRHVDGEYHYFAADRWLPDNNVRDVACGDRIVYIATDGGLGVIEYEPYTLLKKAAYYERHLEEWGQKRLGFTHKLEWDDALGEWVREISDNDVGWSTHYLAAQCFKFAVTGDKQARKEAVNFFDSMKWAEEITPIDGFPARSIWAVGERGHQAQHGSGGLPAEWHATPDGIWQWKADTSSDETDAHCYAVSIFHDLAARDEEKERAKEHWQRVTSHIIDNGWVLRDMDGKPTRWARWDPEYFHSYSGNYARGLNGLEVLAYMRTAHALTGDPKFEAAYRELIGMEYLDEVLREKLVFPPDAIFHSDDRLAFYVYFPLLRYETDPKLRSLYMRSLERSWEVERIEHIPWFNFIYGALTGNDCEAAQAIKHLREWPLDCINYRFRNSHRHDLHTPDGYVPYSGGVKAMSPRERGPMRWSSTPLGLDGGSNREVVDPSGWLDAYWMGRYFGFIAPPDTDDPALTTVKKRSGVNPGAKPYDGPPRP